MNVRVLFGQCAQRQGIELATDHVLALAARQPLAERIRLSGKRIAAEKHPGARPVIQVAEHHRLYRHRRAGHLALEVVVTPIGHRPLRIPRVENRGHRGAQLGMRIGGHTAARRADHLAEQLPEPSVGVARERRTASLGEDPLDLVVDAEVQDGVHHSRHAGRRAAAHRHQQRHRAAPEGVARFGLQPRQALADLRPQPRHEIVGRFEVLPAGIDRRDECRRGRQTRGADLGQAVSLATDHRSGVDTAAVEAHDELAVREQTGRGRPGPDGGRRRCH